MAAAAAAATAAHAVVIEPGTPDSQYVVPENAFPALADLPDEGQGVLIAKRWVVTAAHAAQFERIDSVTINGKPRAVAALILNPGYRKAPQGPMKGDAAPLMAAIASSSDIALIELVKPVEDVAPAPLYVSSDELGKTVEIFGKGATGNGDTGQYPDSPHRGPLRRAYNKIVSADGKWLGYHFDCGAAALPLEGVMGDGDSGGPVLIEKDGALELAGLTSWKHWTGDLANFREGICGQTFYNTRISYFRNWIKQTIAAHN
jgi:hypothetical protein